MSLYRASTVSGPVVLVTGGTRGVGAAIVHCLAARGAAVACGYHSSRDAAQLLADKYPGQVLPVPYTLADAESARAAVAATVTEYGRLDAVIANAGVWAGGKLTKLDEPTWNTVLTANVIGVAQLSRAAIPHLTGERDTSITIVSSVIGIIGGAGDTAYASAKAALIGFGRALAKEIARERIRVNLLAPGFVETDMTAQVTDASRRDISKDILLGRFAEANEIASAATFLCLDATYCTGSILTMDGGWSL